jgi:hypothetical protein
MNRLAIVAAAAALSLPALASVVVLGDTDAAGLTFNATLRASGTLGTAQNFGGAEGFPAEVVYSNVDTFTGGGFANGGTAQVGGSALAPLRATRLVADDTVSVALAPIREVSFSVVNFDTVAVSARPRIRYWAADGALGGPGTLLGGASFNAISFAAGSVNTFFADFDNPATPAFEILFQVPADGKVWAGLMFDNGTAAARTTATVAQLNNLGQGLFNPPTLGSSDITLAYQSTNPTVATPGTNGWFIPNLPGATITISDATGAPNSNLGVEFVAVPEPTSLGLVGLAAMAAFRRRRA